MKVSHEERAIPHHSEQSRVDIPTSYPKAALLAGVLPHDSKPRLSDSLKLPKQQNPKKTTGIFQLQIPILLIPSCWDPLLSKKKAKEVAVGLFNDGPTCDLILDAF